MFKAKYIYKNYAFSIFDHTTIRKKTHQNELDGWKHDGWALAYSSFCENHVRELRTFFTVVLEPNIHTFSVLSETLPDFLKSKLC